MAVGKMKNVRAKLRDSKCDSLLVTSPETIRYFTGFTGSEALLLLTESKRFLLVDSRYTNQARGECKTTRVIESGDKIKEIVRSARKWGVRRVGFEPERLTIAQYRELKKTGAISLKALPEGLEKIRSLKNPDEIRLLKKSAAISSRSFLEMINEIKAGVEERTIALLLEFRIRKNGAEAAPFPFIVASGPRGALPHGVASGKRIRKGELVTIDYGAIYQGYCSDETCTVIIGKPTEKQKRIYQVVKEAHDQALGVVRPGVKAHKIDSVARRTIEKAGLGKYFGHGIGHGVGLAVHEGPRIAPRREERIEEGMVFTIEPGVYIPGWGGVRIEDMVWVTSQGCELMSSVPKELYSV